jgi:hypothetical protein
MRGEGTARWCQGRRGREKRQQGEARAPEKRRRTPQCRARAPDKGSRTP